jgi:hypothetical protein
MEMGMAGSCYETDLLVTELETRHQIDADRHRDDAEEIARLDALAEHEEGEQHAERRHQEMIGAGRGRATHFREMEPEQVSEDRAAKRTELPHKGGGSAVCAWLASREQIAFITNN